MPDNGSGEFTAHNSTGKKFGFLHQKLTVRIGLCGQITTSKLDL